MIPADLRLDTSLIQANPLNLYRLTRTSFATLGGFGSAAFPGRWNRMGQRALYTSVEQGTCVLERLAHQADKRFIPTNLVMMRLQLAGNWVSDANQDLQDQKTGAIVLRRPSLSQADGLPMAGDASSVIAMAVPSVILPVWNFILYPDCELLSGHLSLQEVLPFHFDPRLFAKDASFEAMT